jgi:hypothetical protein
VAVTELANETFSVLHGLALRGAVAELPEGSDRLVRDGLIRATPVGYELTAPGHRRHRALLEIERQTLDLGLLEMAYARLPAITRRLRELSIEWETSDQPTRRQMVARLCAIVDEVELTLHRSSAVAPRFASYGPRLAAARGQLLDSKLEYPLENGVEAILTVWREMNEDFLQTLGCAHDPDDL